MLLGWEIYVGAGATGLRVDELEVLYEDLVSQSINIDSLPHRLIYTTDRLFHLFILRNQVLLQVVHFISFTLNCIKLIIWFRQRDMMEDFQDLLVLILHIDKAKLLPLVFPNKFAELRAMFNFV